MRLKKILGVILFVLGLSMYFFSNYITGQVNEGKAQVSTAEKQIDTGKKLFSLSPYTKDVGKMVTDKGEKKIEEGKVEISKYEHMAKLLHTGGIIFTIAGAGIFLISFVGKKKRK
jgi:hypothetical protein